MDEVVLCYLLRDHSVCLGMKKHGYVANWLNTAGGHVEPNETPLTAAARELLEEMGVIVREDDLVSMGTVLFLFPDQEHHDLHCSIFMTREWTGEPQETEEMGSPEWFHFNNLPIDRLPPTDRHWLPALLSSDRPLSITFYLNVQFEIINQAAQ